VLEGQRNEKSLRRESLENVVRRSSHWDQGPPLVNRGTTGGVFKTKGHLGGGNPGRKRKKPRKKKKEGGSRDIGDYKKPFHFNWPPPPRTEQGRMTRFRFTGRKKLGQKKGNWFLKGKGEQNLPH